MCLGGNECFPSGGSQRIVGVAFEGQHPHSHVLCPIAEMHYDILNIVRFAVNFAVLWKGI